RQVEGLPAKRPLLPQDRLRAKRVAAVQRDRMIEDMQDFHERPDGDPLPPSIPVRRWARNARPAAKPALPAGLRFRADCSTMRPGRSAAKAWFPSPPAKQTPPRMNQPA